jgi:hypothetical protein
MAQQAQQALLRRWLWRDRRNVCRNGRNDGDGATGTVAAQAMAQQAQRVPQRAQRRRWLWRNGRNGRGSTAAQ